MFCHPLVGHVTECHKITMEHDTLPVALSQYLIFFRPSTPIFELLEHKYQDQWIKERRESIAEQRKQEFREKVCAIKMRISLSPLWFRPPQEVKFQAGFHSRHFYRATIAVTESLYMRYLNTPEFLITIRLNFISTHFYGAKILRLLESNEKGFIKDPSIVGIES